MCRRGFCDTTYMYVNDITETGYNISADFITYASDPLPNVTISCDPEWSIEAQAFEVLVRLSVSGDMNFINAALSSGIERFDINNVTLFDDNFNIAKSVAEVTPEVSNFITHVG